MAELKVNMTHDEAAEHLRVEVIGTANRETRPLLSLPNGEGEPPSAGYFGVVRAVMSDTDYVAALYGGWPQAPDTKQIATTAKAVTFIKGIFADATGDQRYTQRGELLYKMFRMGTVHLRSPKTFENLDPTNATKYLTWVLMDNEEGNLRPDLGGDDLQHLELKPWSLDPDETQFPVGVKPLFEDFLTAVEHFATLLDAEAQAGGATPLLDRWRESADAISAKESTTLTW